MNKGRYEKRDLIVILITSIILFALYSLKQKISEPDSTIRACTETVIKQKRLTKKCFMKDNFGNIFICSYSLNNQYGIDLFSCSYN